jgi:alpha-L-fucosidase
VLTAKHMDGYLLWPSRHTNPRLSSYQSQRDLVGDLAQAVRARGLKTGLYYCGGYDGLFNTTVIRDPLTAITAIPQVRIRRVCRGAPTELIDGTASVNVSPSAYADVRELLASTTTRYRRRRQRPLGAGPAARADWQARATCARYRSGRCPRRGGD